MEITAKSSHEIHLLDNCELWKVSGADWILAWIIHYIFISELIQLCSNIRVYWQSRIIENSWIKESSH